MKEIIIATRNKGKIKEISPILSKAGDYKILSLLDYPDISEINEDRFTFAGNAIKKATVISKLKGIPALADDSGLEVDSLNGAPGIRSSRFAGDDASDQQNIEKLLTLLKDVPEEKRSARFQCAMAFVNPSGWIEVTTGSYEGIIISEPKGSNGFGYDPVFFSPRLEKTFAQLSHDEKNQISHRRIALDKMKQILPDIMNVRR